MQKNSEKIKTNEKIDSLHFSPDGKKIVFVQSVGQFESNIMIIDLTTGKTTRLTRDAADDWPFWVP